MTLEQFATLPPSFGTITLFHANNVVSAVNIDVDSCNGLNVASILPDLTTLILNIGGIKYITNVLNVVIYSGYYHFTVQPLTVASTVDVTDCTLTSLLPGLNQVNFTKSNYQALKNNATTQNKSLFIFDVDRKNTQIKPQNYEAIISGSATKAAYQELNYTSIGLTNSRYEGAKTSTTQFGVKSAVSGAPFLGASYLSSSIFNSGSEDSFIFSQSLSDRDIETYLFEGNTETPESGSSIFTLEGNKILPLRNKKVWVKNSRKILYTNNIGNVYTVKSGSL